MEKNAILVKYAQNKRSNYRKKKGYKILIWERKKKMSEFHNLCES